MNELALKEEGRSQEHGHILLAWESRVWCFAAQGPVSDTLSQISLPPLQSPHTPPILQGEEPVEQNNLFFGRNFGTPLKCTSAKAGQGLCSLLQLMDPGTSNR